MSTNASQQQDPIELLRTIAPALQNGHRETLKLAAEMIKKLQAERDELRQALAGQPLPEAMASVNFRMVHTVTQAEGLFILRSHSDTELQERLQRRISSLVDSGWIAFDAYMDQRQAEREANGNSPPRAMPPTLPPVVPTAPPVAGQQSGELTFPAKILSCETKDGKPYWKVKGGKFLQHGVRVWPEVLEAAGLNPLQLDPQIAYDLEGYTATYITNDRGQAQKVVKLAR